MTEISECHCPACGWEGQYDEADEQATIYSDEFWGASTVRTEYLYRCPLCGEELEDGPFPDDEDNPDPEAELARLVAQHDIDVED